MCAPGRRQGHQMCFICHFLNEQAASKLRESKTPTGLEAFSKLTLEDQSAPKVEEINKTPTCMETFSSINVAEMEERKTPALSFVNNELLSHQFSSLSLDKSNSESKSKSDANGQLQSQMKILHEISDHSRMKFLMESRVHDGVRFALNLPGFFNRLETKTLKPFMPVSLLIRELSKTEKRIYNYKVKHQMEMRAHGGGLRFGPALTHGFKRVKKTIPVASRLESFAWNWVPNGENSRISWQDIKRRR
ncbi:uncharacterized protein LOC120272980 [Dioscorea cayenensis subsp. rotundata]|uniref:Uncharacterized protein LOC120272980 n=1 Tax=Dioscorea cayennensis subsp. rotundata TaxID=55577 RepID=A0AB40C6V8_DIOCR|nr:uncharacterized protein LOC120272980 [Dioscorea cayenensis subsp. rotundata]